MTEQVTEEPTGLDAVIEKVLAELRETNRHLRNLEKRLDMVEASARAGRRRGSR